MGQRSSASVLDRRPRLGTCRGHHLLSALVQSKNPLKQTHIPKTPWECHRTAAPEKEKQQQQWHHHPWPFFGQYGSPMYHVWALHATARHRARILARTLVGSIGFDRSRRPNSQPSAGGQTLEGSFQTAVWWAVGYFYVETAAQSTRTGAFRDSIRLSDLDSLNNLVISIL